MKPNFTTIYTDKTDGAKTECKVLVEKINFKKELGDSFIFITAVHQELDGNPVKEIIAIPARALSKLIKALGECL